MSTNYYYYFYYKSKSGRFAWKKEHEVSSREAGSSNPGTLLVKFLDKSFFWNLCINVSCMMDHFSRVSMCPNTGEVKE